MAALSQDPGEGMFRRAFAYLQADGDPESVASYAYMHHDVADARVGAANVAGCRSAIEELNADFDISDAERRAVHNHLRQHLADAGVTDVPNLRTRRPRREELVAWASEDEGFRALLADIGGAAPIGIEMLLAHMREDAQMRQAVKDALAEIERPSAIAEWYGDRWASRKRDAGIGA
jgi:hypothetical protein